jgi:hypothetical protein
MAAMLGYWEKNGEEGRARTGERER